MVPNGWTATTIGQHVDLLSGYPFRSAEYTDDDCGIRLLRGDNIGQGFLRWRDVKRWPVSKLDGLDDYKLKSGDFVIAMDRTWIPSGVKVSEVKEQDLPCLLVQRVSRLRAKPSLTQKLLKHFFSSHRYEQYVKKVQTETAVPHISPTDIREYPIHLPPITEQDRIADILCTWDRAIETTERLIENSKAQKKALMQQLLTGKKRFDEFIVSNDTRQTRYGLIPTDWDFIKLSDVAKEVVDRNQGRSDFPVLSCSKYDGFVNSLEYFKKQVFSSDTSNYKVIRRGQFGFPSNHIEEGSIGYQDVCDDGLVSPIYCVFEVNSNVDHGYLYSLLKTEHYRQIFSAATNASVDRRGSLRWKDFSKIYVPLPTKPEQEKICAAIVSATTDEQLSMVRFQNLQSEKAALMQQLMTGKRRVIINKENTEAAHA